MKFIAISLWVVGGLAGLVTLLFLGISILGHVGILADVGYEENRAIGLQALWIGLGAQGICMAFFFLAWWSGRNAKAAAGGKGVA